jgi:hypothetical protein
MASSWDRRRVDDFNRRSGSEYSKLSEGKKQLYDEVERDAGELRRQEEDNWKNNKDEIITRMEERLHQHYRLDQKIQPPPGVATPLKTNDEIRREASERAEAEHQARMERIEKDRSKALDRIRDDQKEK